MAKFYTIKSCVQGKLHDIASQDATKDIAIDFCNTFNTERSSDSIEARVNGVPAITLESNVKYTFKLGMEVLTEEVLAMIIGGEVNEAGEIIVGAEAPSTVYSYSGVFTMYGDDGSKLVKRMTIGKVKPIVNTSVDFSAIDLSTFELQFNIMLDEEELFMKVTKDEDGGDQGGE